MSALDPGILVDALAVDIPLEPLPAEHVLEGAPTAGAISLGELAGAEIGVWEMTEGVATDIEVDEVFVVIAGSATVEFIGDGAPEAIELAPGAVVRLTEGMRTVWRVRGTLRKVWVG